MPRRARYKRALLLYCFFARIGLFTFGGGWGIVAQMQREFVEKRGWITGEALMDLVSVARSLPGLMIANACVQFGYHVGGVPCAVAAVAGMVTPPVAILSLVTIGYEAVKDNLYVARALIGVRAAVIPIIAMAALKLRKAALKDVGGYLVMAAAFFISVFTPLSKLVIVLLGAAAGLMVMEVRGRGVR